MKSQYKEVWRSDLYLLNIESNDAPAVDRSVWIVIESVTDPRGRDQAICTTHDACSWVYGWSDGFS